jgi:hypothetical protein
VFAPCKLSARATPKFSPCIQPPTSKHHNFVNMGDIQAAIEAIEAHELGEDIPHRKYAAAHAVKESTLSRRVRGITGTKEAARAKQQALTPSEEVELCRYIGELSERGIPSTRAMIQSFGSTVAGREVSISWVQRFLHRNKAHLSSHWSASIDRVRFQADSPDKYKRYFDLLYHKIREHGIEQRFTYNMDEKGFMIGVEGKSKRWFSKDSWRRGGCRAAIQDGNREWITVLATVCGDGTSVPPGIIFQAKNGNIRDTWVDSILADNHQVFVTSSDSGWTNNDLGMAWLRDVFDRHTKEKCRRSYRLLILDGHGSHVTESFINYCDQNQILLAVFPPHSTHTLQPLDVGMFSPLSRAYVTELGKQQQQSLGLLTVKKGDFFDLFWAAYTSSFTADNILASFRATGIWPMDSGAVLKRWEKRTPSPKPSQPSLSELSPPHWDRIGPLLRQAVQDSGDNLVQKLESLIHRATTHTKLLEHQNQGLEASLRTKNKRRRNGKALNLSGASSTGGGLQFFSPSSLANARAQEAEQQHQKKVQAIEKADKKKLQEASKLLREKLTEERRQGRERAKVVREKERAEKAAEKQRKKEEENAAKALQLSQKGKRKASSIDLPKQTRQKRSRGGAAVVVAQEAASPAPAKKTSRGRNVHLPSKFR